MAAQQVGIENVPVEHKKFASEDAAVEYAIHCQRDRRNISNADLVRWVLELDKRKTKAETLSMATEAARQAKTGEPSEAPLGATDTKPGSHHKSSHDTAAVLGIGSRTVERIRTVIDHAPEEIKQAMEKGEMSICAAAKETQKLRRQEDKESGQPETEKGEEYEMGKGEFFYPWFRYTRAK
jgi:hypothetical protein